MSVSRHGRTQIVVVGGGFAGLAVVRELRHTDADVLLLDRDPYNTFQPLLYQVATGGLNPGDVTYALRAFASRFPNARFRRALVTEVDVERRLVRTDQGLEIPYDYLVLCCGVTANFFGIDGAAQHARTIYTRSAAIHVRHRVMTNLESVAQGLPGTTEPVMVVVGGGATGVEMAGTLAAQDGDRAHLPGARPHARARGARRDDPRRARPVRAEAARVRRERAARPWRRTAARHCGHGGRP